GPVRAAAPRVRRGGQVGPDRGLRLHRRSAPRGVDGGALRGVARRARHRAPHPSPRRREVSGRTGAAAPGPRAVAVGGGHGLAASLQAARTYAGELTAVVSVADDGGSTGRLRAGADRPAPGDLRKCLVALADEGSLLARAM